jgi:SAM-dependent methyltransferase
MPTAKTEELNKSFLDEYNSDESVRKYSTRTAGRGINYLLRHDYAKVYGDAIDECLETSRGTPLRILEYGCGAGMNLIRLVSLLEERRIPVAEAYGADFSVPLVESARAEARRFTPRGFGGRISFHVARNEHLAEDLASASGASPGSLDGSFDLIVGVNTFRYCHRLAAERTCASDIYRLLRPGGVSVMIDMNDRFPLFRSHLTRSTESAEETYLPSLNEYTRPFEQAGFTITTKDNFCWTPHSAGRGLTLVSRLLSPVLNLVARSYAMRSLVVARKPA